MRLNEKLRPHELWGLMALFMLHVFVLPLMVISGEAWWGWDFGGLSQAGINLVYYSVDLVLCFVFAGGYLRRSFDSLLDRPLNALQAYLLGLAIYFAFTAVLNMVLFSFEFFNAANPNQEAVTEVARQYTGTMIAISVFMTPIVEETIFRGGIFCGLYHKNRILAYVVSIAAFSVYHVWQYAFAASDLTVLLFAVEYIPAAFMLCWSYEKSGSIWTCIALHMSINALSVLLL